jgi:uncharacterized membrane protein YccC
MIPPRQALVAALIVTGTVTALAALAWWLGGGVAALGVVLGVMAGLPAAVASVPARVQMVVAGLGAAALVAGLASSDKPWLAGAAVVVAGLAGAPLAQRSAGLGGMLPVLVALGASAGLPNRPVALAAWLLVGAGGIMLVALVLGAQRAVPGVGRRMALTHSVAVGVAGGVAMVIAGVLDIEHGYWTVLALAATLRPVAGQTGEVGRNRIIGTAVGAVLAIVIVLFVPTGVALLVAAVCLLLTLAWAVGGDELRQAVFSTPVVLLVASSGLASRAVEVASERLILTGAGIVLAVVMALLVQRVDQGTPAVAKSAD